MKEEEGCFPVTNPLRGRGGKSIKMKKGYPLGTIPFRRWRERREKLR